MSFRRQPVEKGTAQRAAEECGIALIHPVFLRLFLPSEDLRCVVGNQTFRIIDSPTVGGGAQKAADRLYLAFSGPFKVASGHFAYRVQQFQSHEHGVGGFEIGYVYLNARTLNGYSATSLRLRHSSICT